MKLKFKINPTKKQKEAYSILHDDDCQILVARWSRQCGKTVFAEMMIIENLCKPKTFNAYISPTYSQGRKVFKELNDLLEGKGIVKKSNSSTLTIETIFKSTFQAFTMENPNAIRGYTVNGILVLDECSFFPDVLTDGSEPWSSIIMPITKARKPKVLMISTPKGKRGMFYDMYLKAVAGEKGYKQLTATIYDDELVAPEEIENIKKTVSPLGFKEEFMVEFLDSSLTFFKGYENSFNEFNFNDNTQKWLGFDLSAEGEDATIATIINGDNQVKQIEISGTLDMKYKQISDVINSTSNLQMVYFETNGIGQVMLNEVVKMVKDRSKIKEWVTTNDSKEKIVTNLAMEIANKNILFNINDKKLYAEFGTFIAKYTKTGRMQFEASSGKHDDRIMSLAIALQAKHDYDYKFTKTFANILKI